MKTVSAPKLVARVAAIMEDGGSGAAEARTVAMPDVREKLGALRAEIVADSPEEFAAIVNAEVVEWTDIVKKSGARVD